MPGDSGRSRRGRTLRLALGGLVLLALAGASMAFIAGGPGELAALITSLDPRLLLAVVAFILASDVVKAVRLRVILASMGYRMGLGAALAARILGRFMGLLTPGSVGATPGRAAIIGAYTGAPIGTALGVSLIETLADSVMAALVAVAASVPLLPRSALLVAISLGAIMLWLAGVAATASGRVAESVYRRLRLPEYLRCRVEVQRRLLLRALGEVKDPSLSVKTTVLTLASHAVEALSVAVVVWGQVGGAARALVVSLAAVEAAYVASVFPTPGGGGAVEYSLSLFLDPQALVYWRIGHLLVGMAPALLLLAVIPGLRSYLREGALNGGGGESCGADREDIRYARAPLRV